MIIKSIHIENFGKLSNVSIDFSDGVNVICEDNAWGKSTLASFIKAMFYGFEGKSRDITKSDRKRYTPWQGGAFGGNLVFETQGKTLRIERLFGTKDGSDTCTVRDVSTQLEISEYDGVCVGEKLFGLDRDSFARTVFVLQSDCETGPSDDINAKLGNMTAFDDDMGKCDKALTELKKDLSALSETRVTGEIKKLKVEIAEKEQTVKSAGIKEQQLEELNRKKSEQLGLLKQIEKETEILREKQAVLSKKKDMDAKLREYTALRAQAEERRVELEAARLKLPENIPEPETLENALNTASELAGAEAKRDLERLSEDERRELEETGNLPETDEITDLVSKWNTRVSKKCEIAANTSVLEMLRSGEREDEAKFVKKLRVMQTAVLVPGILMLAAGIMSFAIPGFDLGLLTEHHLFLGMGIAFIVAGEVLIRKRKKERPESAGTRRIRELEGRLEEDRNTASDIEKEVIEWCSTHDLAYNEDSVQDDLLAIKERTVRKRERLSSLLERAARYEASEKNCLVLKEKLDGILAGMYKEKAPKPESGLGYLNVFRSVEADIPVYMRTLRAFQKAEELVTATGISEADANGSEEASGECIHVPGAGNMPGQEGYPALDGPESLEEIGDRLSTLTGSARQAMSAVSAYERQIETICTELDDIGELQGNLEELKKKLAQKKLHAGHMAKAYELLEKARTNLTARYAKPLKDAFDGFYGTITGLDTANIHIDAHSMLTYDEMGSRHETNTLSAGFRDLTGIALRMSFVKAMYEGEKPPIIFDDPFVMLDGDKLEGAKRLTVALAKEYQIIYFTCHESRAID